MPIPLPTFRDIAEIAKWAWANRSKLRKWTDNWRTWYKSSPKSPEMKVLIIGAGGTGKTTLAKLLSKEYDWELDPLTGYVESISRENYTVSAEAEPVIEAIVDPGQESRRSDIWPETLQSIASGDVHGIILLNCFGYHTLGVISLKQHRLYRGRKADFIKNYLNDRRNEEIKILAQIAASIELATKPVWLLSIITKRDLWNRKQEDVYNHYANGRYASIVGKLVKNKPGTLFRHGLEYGSLVITNLVSGDNELLSKSMAGFQQVYCSETLVRIRKVLSDLTAWRNAR
jgi:hypothetical protein